MFSLKNSFLCVFFILFISFFLFAENSNIIDIFPDHTIEHFEVWEENVYLHGRVYVDGVLLIRPGVIVYNSYDGGIVVNEGGRIIAVGNPNNYIFFVPASFSFPFADYEFAIKILGPSQSRIEYCFFDGAQRGLWIEQGIEELYNNIFYYCFSGIHIEFARQATNIFNNKIIDSYFAGIHVEFYDPNGPNTFDPISVDISNNTIVGSWFGNFGQEYGIYVSGTREANSGHISIYNNIIVGSYDHAIGQYDGYMTCFRGFNAYGMSGLSHINEGNPFEDIESIFLWQDPFYYGHRNGFFYVLDPCSVVINKGLSNVWETKLAGMTTCPYGTPDSGFINLGYHYPNWHYVSSNDELVYSVADINNDGAVDIVDLLLLADNWLKITDPNLVDPNYPEKIASISNLGGEAIINLYDFSILAKEWLTINYDIYNFDINISSHMAGFNEIIVEIENFPEYIISSYVFINGRYYSELSGHTGIIRTDILPNGHNEIKIVMLRNNGEVLVSGIEEIYVDNFVSDVIDEDFYCDEGYKLIGVCKYDNFVVRVNNWEYDGTGGLINIFIPSSAFEGIIDEIIIEELPYMDGMLGSEIFFESDVKDMRFNYWRKKVYKKFDRLSLEDPDTVRAVLILTERNITRLRWPVVSSIMNAFEHNNIRYVVLYHTDAEWGNINFVLRGLDTEFVYYLGHGNSEVRLGTHPVVYRTSFRYWEEEYSFFSYRYSLQPVFSFVANDKPGIPDLPGDYDSCRSIRQLRLRESVPKKWVFIDACQSARFLDMAEAFDIILNDGRNNWGVYMGWQNDARVPSEWQNLLLRHNTILSSVFDHWRQGNSLNESLSLATSGAGKAGREALWGIQGREEESDNELGFFHNNPSALSELKLR